MIEIEETVEMITRIEAEIEGTVEIYTEVEIDLTQEIAEEINKNLDQVKDTLTTMDSVTTVTELVIQHIGVSD